MIVSVIYTKGLNLYENLSPLVYDGSLRDMGQEKDRKFTNPSKKLEALVAVYLLRI